MAAYRIIQEALTNALKHAGRVPTVVALQYAPDALDVEITGRGTRAHPAEHTGHGLIGMRERVALYHGELEAGPLEPAGFAVRAHLPLAAAAS